MEATKQKFLSILRRAFSIHSIGTKITVTCLIDCLILVVAIAIIFSTTIYKQEVAQVDSLLASDSKLLGMALGTTGDHQWHIINGELYCGDLYLGDGTPEKANNSVMAQVKELTGGDVYVLMPCSTDDLKWQGTKKKGYQEGPFIRVAGTTHFADGKSIVGTKIDTKVLQKISENGGTYSGFANVDGSNMYAYYRNMYDSEGNVVAILATSRMYENMEQDIKTIRNQILYAIIAIIILAGLAIIGITTRWVGNVTKVEQYLDRIIEEDLPDDPLIIKSNDEIRCVADSINEMVKSLKDKQRLGAELSLATDIQLHMLPREFPAFPDRPEIDIFASMHPAKEVGGDFYDFFFVDDKRLALVIADVSGKGVPAALFMMITKIMIKNYVQMGLQPGNVFTVVNRILTEGNQSDMFVTAWLAVINLETGEMTFTNAGHNPPMIRHKNGEYEVARIKPGFVLGGMEGMQYGQKVIPLVPGDKIFLYTDGITEATNKDQEQYGTKRLTEYLNSHKDDNVTDLLKGLKENVDEFVGLAEQFDDMTMLGFSFRSHMKESDEHDLYFPASDEALHEATSFVEEHMEKAGMSPKLIMRISLALEEIFVNIAHYAYPNMEGTVCIGITDYEDRIRIRFTDSGIPFNPLLKEDPDVNASVDERGIGGLGIYLVKQLMDDVQYEYVNGKNVLTMIKKKEEN